MHLSIIIPLYNEEECLPELLRRLRPVSQQYEPYEIIFIDDGSTDKTLNVLLQALEQWPQIKIIKFEKNAGQTDALAAGFKIAQGDYLAILDGDLQNPPEAIPLLMDAIHDADAVVGWRAQRQDIFLKKIGSRIANGFRRLVLKDPFHDSACGLKLFKKNTVSQLTFYKNFHTFLPVLLQWQGFKVREIQVPHEKRTHGQSKYKTFSFVVIPSLINLFAVLWIHKHRLTYRIEKNYKI